MSTKKHFTTHVKPASDSKFDFRIDGSNPDAPTVTALNDAAFKEMQANVPAFLIDGKTVGLNVGAEADFAAGLRKEGWQVEVIGVKSAVAAD